MTSVYCEMYGNTMDNRVMEYLMCHQAIGIAVGDMAREIKISRPKAYEIIKELLSRKLVIKSRIVAGTQLYILNKDNPSVKIYIRNFKECIRMAVDEVAGKYPQMRSNHTSNNMNVGTVSARNR